MSAIDAQRLRGGFYTPDAIAGHLTNWALADHAQRVLEPSAGDGAFLRAIARSGRTPAVVAVEYDGEEAAKSRASSTPGAEILCGDALAMLPRRGDFAGGFDAVVGNPPFIRYQLIDGDVRDAGEAIMGSAGLATNRLTNLWVPFVVLSTLALRPGGRLAMVLPAELMQVSYAAQLRAFLARSYSELTLTTFRKLTFPGIQQEVVLLTAVRGDGQSSARISISHLDGIESLEARSRVTPIGTHVELDHASEKWLQYYLTPSEIGLLREATNAPGVVALGALARVNVGIVTGRNEFFVLRPSEADAWGVREFCLPLIGRSAQIPGVRLTRADWERLVERDGRCLLLQLGKTARGALTPAARAYVAHGESLGYDLGYKCRIRQPTWWHVPSDQVPDAFMLRQIHDAPRIVLNSAAVTSTDTIHRVFAKPGVSAEALAASSLNSLTLAFSEIMGRSYGGGVLELEPREAQALPFPEAPGARLADLGLDASAAAPRVEDVDALVLAPLGFSRRDTEGLRRIWSTMSARRVQRRAIAPDADRADVA